jgi:hypothetical protein
MLQIIIQIEIDANPLEDKYDLMLMSNLNFRNSFELRKIIIYLI